MRRAILVRLAAGLLGVSGGSFAAVAGCSSSQTVEPAKTCANPCCDGPLAGIDCAETPNLSCTEDADPCTARSYGCVNGKHYVTDPSQVPTSCGEDGSVDDVGFVFGGD
jgi:hypothetical protein